MPRFAIYEPLPGDPLSGPIIQITSKSRAAMESDERPFVEIPTSAAGSIDSTHEIVAGELVERPPA